MKNLLFCKGDKCNYYKKYYEVVKYEGGYIPNFNMTDERCTHPTEMNKHTTLKNIENIGSRLMIINKCPKDEKAK